MMKVGPNTVKTEVPPNMHHNNENDDNGDEYDGWLWWCLLEASSLQKCVMGHIQEHYYHDCTKGFNQNQVVQHIAWCVCR